MNDEQRQLAKMTPEQNTGYERLKQAAASVWSAGNMYIGPSMRELMCFLGEYKRLSPEYEQHLEMVNAPALSDERIFKLFLEKAVDKGTAGIYDFARAIEREILG